MLFWFQVCSKVNHFYTYLYSLFFRFFAHIGHYRVLSRVPCAIQQILISYLFYIQICVHISSWEITFLGGCARLSELLGFLQLQRVGKPQVVAHANSRACGLQQLRHKGLTALPDVNLPRPGLRPTSPTLAGRFSTTGPPGKSTGNHF